MGYAIDILNNIRANASTEYQTRVPEATQQNIITIGNALETYTVLFNEFAEALFNKIGKTIIESKLFKNKLARFKSGAITTQQDVEEIFVDMGKAATAYDPDGKNPLGRRNDDNVKVVYHRMNRQDCYDISIGDIDFIRVFRSEASLANFIKSKINAVYSRAAHDEWLYMKNTLATFTHTKTDGTTASYFDYEVPAFAEGKAEASAKSFVKTLRKAVNDVGFASDKYNAAGVTTWTDPEKLVLLVNKDVVAEVDVEVLAKAFNLGKTDINVTIITMDDFGSLTDTYGLLIDEEFFKVWDTLSRMESQRNAQGLFTNFFYHVHQILSASPFKTAVRFKAV
jgi:hypothetical protein